MPCLLLQCHKDHQHACAPVHCEMTPEGARQFSFIRRFFFQNIDVFQVIYIDISPEVHVGRLRTCDGCGRYITWKAKVMPDSVSRREVVVLAPTLARSARLLETDVIMS